MTPVPKVKHAKPSPTPDEATLKSCTPIYDELEREYREQFNREVFERNELR
jgi:hypothetical protein